MQGLVIPRRNCANCKDCKCIRRRHDAVARPTEAPKDPHRAAPGTSASRSHIGRGSAEGTSPRIASAVDKARRRSFPGTAREWAEAATDRLLPIKPDRGDAPGGGGGGSEATPPGVEGKLEVVKETLPDTEEEPGHPREGNPTEHRQDTSRGRPSPTHGSTNGVDPDPAPGGEVPATPPRPGAAIGPAPGTDHQHRDEPNAAAAAPGEPAPIAPSRARESLVGTDGARRNHGSVSSARKRSRLELGCEATGRGSLGEETGRAGRRQRGGAARKAVVEMPDWRRRPSEPVEGREPGRDPSGPRPPGESEGKEHPTGGVTKHCAKDDGRGAASSSTSTKPVGTGVKEAGGGGGRGVENAGEGNPGVVCVDSPPEYLDQEGPLRPESPTRLDGRKDATGKPRRDPTRNTPVENPNTGATPSPVACRPSLDRLRATSDDIGGKGESGEPRRAPGVGLYPELVMAATSPKESRRRPRDGDHQSRPSAPPDKSRPRGVAEGGGCGREGSGGVDQRKEGVGVGGGGGGKKWTSPPYKFQEVRGLLVGIRRRPLHAFLPCMLLSRMVIFNASGRFVLRLPGLCTGTSTYPMYWIAVQSIVLWNRNSILGGWPLPASFSNMKILYHHTP